MTGDVEFRPISRAGNGGDLIAPDRPVTAHGHRIRAGRMVRRHAHPRSQLAMGVSGVMRFQAGGDTWIVPPGHALWIPGGIAHAMQSETEIVTRHLLIDPSAAPHARPETHCAVLRISPLLREMAGRLAEGGPLGSDDPAWQRLAAATLDEIARLAVSDLGLPGGEDARLVRVTRHLNAHPDDKRGLPELAAMAGSTERTLTRLFRAETGLGFRQWRNRQRMLLALQALEGGQSSNAVAERLGYGSASAFIAAFRRTLGASPQKVLRGARRP